MKTVSPLSYLSLLLMILFLSVGELPSQVISGGIGVIKRPDPRKSNLVREPGTIYLADMFDEEMRVRIGESYPVYTDLSASRWIGTLKPNQPAVLLAISDKAFRVRAQAQQGQIAGWVSKSAVVGIPEGFEEDLRTYHQRFLAVQDLIENHQIALGMTMEEVSASIGQASKRTSTVTTGGRVDTLDYIFYKQVPETYVVLDAFGQPYTATRYVKVESGRITVDFTEGVVSSITESKDLDRSRARLDVTIPPPPLLE